MDKRRTSSEGRLPTPTARTDAFFHKRLKSVRVFVTVTMNCTSSLVDGSRESIDCGWTGLVPVRLHQELIVPKDVILSQQKQVFQQNGASQKDSTPRDEHTLLWACVQQLTEKHPRPDVLNELTVWNIHVVALS